MLTTSLRSIFGAFALAMCAMTSTGCVTINVYLPTEEIQDAAREIVDEVRPELSEVEIESSEPVGLEETRNPWPTWVAVSSLVSSADAGEVAASPAALLGVATLQDGKKVKLNITTPKIKAIRKTLKARYKKLFPFYQKLAVGEGKDGYLSVRDEKKLSVREKRDLKILVKKENEDRQKLYLELAAANRIEKKEVPKIAALFSAEWQRKCKVGWWIQGKKGKWEPKKPPKKKGRPAGGSK